MDTNQNSKTALKSKWSLEEDEFLRQLANKQIKHDWVIIASLLKQKFSAIDKTPKQCRQRFVNALSIPRSGGPLNSWTDQEYERMMFLFQSHGFKWTKIAAQLETKTENNIKNKFYSSLRKLVRRINNTTRIGEKKFKKDIRFESVLRIISISKSWNLPHKVLQDSSKIICHQILQNMKQTQLSFPEKIIDLGHRINKLNLQTRSFKCQKAGLDANNNRQRNGYFEDKDNLGYDHSQDHKIGYQDLNEDNQSKDMKVQQQDQGQSINKKGRKNKPFEELEDENSILGYYGIQEHENGSNQEDIYLEYFKNVESPLSFSNMY